MKIGKRLLGILLTGAMLLSLCACLGGKAPEENVQQPNSLEYRLTEDGTGYEVTGIGTYESSDIVIPDTYQGLPVTGIAYGAFMLSEKVTGVTFGNNVKVIGESAFWQCPNLKEVNFSDSIEKICGQAFAHCPRIAFLEFGKGLTTIEDTAFMSCYDLVSVTLNEALTTIEPSTFGSYKLFEIVNNSSLDISLEDLYTGDHGGIVSRGTVDIHKGESNLRIENDYIFGTHEGKHYLLGYIGSDRDLVLPESIGGESYEIYKYAFSYTDRFSTIDTGEGVTAIGEDAFLSNEALLSLRIGKAVRESDGEFGLKWGIWGRHKLVELINASAIPIVPGCDELGQVRNTAVIVHNGESVVKREGDFSYASLEGVNYILEYRGAGGKLQLPESINGQPFAVWDFAFCGRKDITGVSFGGATAIGANAFSKCAIQELDIGDTVQKLEERAFEGNQIKSVKIGKGLKEVTGNPFADIPPLESITVSQENPYFHATGNCLIETATKTLISGCITSVIPEGEVTIIADEAFFGASGDYYDNVMSTVVVPEGVTSIGAYAFHFSGLQEITLPSTLHYIGEAVAYNYECMRINFSGTKAQWQAIEKAEDWDIGMNRAEIVCTDGTITSE